MRSAGLAAGAAHPNQVYSGQTGAGSGAASTGSVYKDSLLRLLDYVGLTGYGTDSTTMPPRTQAETDLIALHRSAIEEQARRHAERNKHREFQNKKLPLTTDESALGLDLLSDRTIYLSLEETIEWRAFMAGVPPEARHTATTRRRLSLVLWRAHTKRLCLFCWMPTGNCICNRLEHYRQAMPQSAVAEASPVTMLLHAEELMRSTNSGHIAAFLLDAPLCVWGVPADGFIAHLPAQEEEEEKAATAGAGSKRMVRTLHTSLYPAEDAETIEAFISKAQLADSPPPTAETERGRERERETVMKRVHLMLLDSTWPQAHSLNRHVASAVPRVALDIPASYEARFARLRKRTRESGVSTLEATSMAVEQCLCALDRPAEAAQASAQLMAAMEEFVDTKCLLKFTEVEFSKDTVAVQVIVSQRDAARREASMRRQAKLQARVRDSEEARRLLLPPVLNYCYCCERVIGWHRMAEHVLGKGHRLALRRNPTCEPSAHSRLEVVPDYARPMRQKDASTPE